jgi:TonB-linked SusC/RagA family outer membrane protein
MRSKFKWIFTLLLAFSMQFSFAQEKTVTGVVTDKIGPLPGANVVVKGTTNGVQTDFDGKYSIKTKKGDVILVSFTGYNPKSITVGDSNTYNFVLDEGVQLQEVVVVAYGNEKKSQVSGAVSIVKAKSIEQVPIASLDQVLQGNVAGLTISTGSGQPGQSGTILIRGASSISGNSEPLFIIDGVPVDEDNFRSLNANDIENISVLKDASSAALYGSRGASGVIVVTTKKGKFESGLKVQYRSLYGISLRPNPNFEVMNAKQFLTYQRDVLGAGYGATGTSGSIVGSGPLSDAEIDAISLQTNTNWSDIFFREGTTKSHELNISTGGDKNRSYTSIGYFEQQGITLASALQRFTFRTNFDANPSDKFHYGYNMTFNYSKNNFVIDADRGANTGGELDNPFIVPYIGLPYQSPYNADGSINIVGTQLSGAFNADGSYNANNANGFQNTPYLALNTLKLNTDRENEIKSVVSLNADYKLFKNVKVGALFGLDYTGIESLNLTNPLSIRGGISPTQTSTIKGDQSEGFFRDARFNINSFVTYANTFNGKHNLEVSAFTEYYYQNIKNAGFTAFGLNPALLGSGSGFADPSLLEGGVAVYAPGLFSSHSELRLFSYFGVAKYDYEDRFGFQVSIRRDASSRFLKENQWGTFGSISGRWSINNEKFMEKYTKLNDLKLRASYGVVGNQSIGGFNVGQATVGGGVGYGGQPSYNPTFVDPNLVWETTRQLNIGLDFGFYDRFRGAIDVYEKDTFDLFLSTQLAPTTGFAAVNRNIGTMSNRGIELELSYDLVRNNDWTVNIFANGSYNKNEITQLDGLADFQGTGATRLQVGEQLNSYNLVRWAGVDPSNGQPLYYDVNGNVTNQYNLAADRVATGKSSIPVYNGGFGLNARYKDFSLSTLFSYAAEQYRLNSSLGVIEDPSLAGFSNQSITALDAWQNPGDITSIPGVQYNAIRNQLTTRYLEDASFLRLRNVTLAYSLNGNKFGTRKYFDSIRFTLQAVNMFTWTKYRGFDPESNSTANFFDYPTARQFTFGIDINL